MTPPDLVQLVGDRRQFASVRKIVLDEGPERGVRALLFSTGGGLDFMVLVDRGLDVGTLQFRGRPLAWQSPAGFRSPFLTDLENDGGRGFNRSFSGLLMTCGLEHTRQPNGQSPLHGKLPGTPATLRAHGERWGENGEGMLYCEGEIVQSSYGAESLVLRRRIEAPVGATEIRIIDEVENVGPAPAAHEILYHLNFGYPLLADGTVIALDNRPVWTVERMPDPAAGPQVVCHPVSAGADAAAVTLRPVAGPGGLREVRVTSSASLPYVQFWRDLRPRVGVLAVEPCSTPAPALAPSAPVMLEPGARRRYTVSIECRG